METYVANEWLANLLRNTSYAYGFTREQPLSEIEVRERQLLLNGCVAVEHLGRWARRQYPWDGNLTTYTWGVLLHNDAYLEYMYPGFGLRGRGCDLDIVHIATGQERGKWLANGGDPDALLDVDAWAIGIASLQNQYHKLYVHDDRPDGLNVCRDGFGHRHFAYTGVHLDRYFAKAEATIGLDAWHRQARVQGVNPCIYSVIQGWIPTLPSL